jgi:hypothetical protein
VCNGSPGRCLGVDVCYKVTMMDADPVFHFLAQLTIGWEPFKRLQVSVDEYETGRPERRNRTDLTMPWMERKKLLRRSSNASDEEIRAAMYDVQTTRKQRARTLNMTPCEFILPFRWIKRKMKRRFSS